MDSRQHRELHKTRVLRAAVPAIITAALCLVIAIAWDFYYDLNDDTMMAAILSGAYTGSPALRNIQSYYPLTALLGMLQRLIRGIPWYGLFLAAMPFVCLYLVLRRIVTITTVSPCRGGGTAACSGPSARAEGVGNKAENNIHINETEENYKKNNINKNSNKSKQNRGNVTVQQVPRVLGEAPCNDVQEPVAGPSRSDFNCLRRVSVQRAEQIRGNVTVQQVPRVLGEAPCNDVQEPAAGPSRSDFNCPRRVSVQRAEQIRGNKNNEGNDKGNRAAQGPWNAGTAACCLIAVLLFTGLMLYHLVFLQYSVVVGVMGATASFLFLTMEEKESAKAWTGQILPQLILIWLGFLLRSEMMMFISPFVALSFLIRLLDMDLPWVCRPHRSGESGDARDGDGSSRGPGSPAAAKPEPADVRSGDGVPRGPGSLAAAKHEQADVRNGNGASADPGAVRDELRDPGAARFQLGDAVSGDSIPGGGERKTDGGAGRKRPLSKLSAALLTLALVLMGLAGGYLGNYVGYASQEWWEFYEFFDARTELYDFQKLPEYEGNEAFYESIGLDEAQAALIINYNFGLDDDINAEIIAQIAAYADEKAAAEESTVQRLKNALWDYRHAFSSGTEQPYNTIAAVLYILAFAAVLQRGICEGRSPRRGRGIRPKRTAKGGASVRKQTAKEGVSGGKQEAQAGAAGERQVSKEGAAYGKQVLKAETASRKQVAKEGEAGGKQQTGKMSGRAESGFPPAARLFLRIAELLVLFAGRSALLLYLYYNNRPVVRLTHSIYLAEAVILVWMILESLPRGVSSAVVEPACREGAADRGGLRKGGIRIGRSADPVIRIAFSVLLTVLFLYGLVLQVRDVQEEYISREEVNSDWIAFMEYCESNPEKVYFTDVYSTVSFSEKIFDGREEAVNYDLMGGWVSKSPLEEQKLAFLGLESEDASAGGGTGAVMQAALLEEDCYLVSRSSYDIAWIVEYYDCKGIAVTVTETDHIGEFWTIYSVMADD